MIIIRKSNDRGHFDHGWLDTYHTFSFGDYRDPQHMGFRSLRVINEDRVAPARGFGMHPHRDMEIITYVLQGALSHRDSTGRSETIRPGEVQRMTAGSGISHSEFNASESEPVHLLQIWLLPNQRGLAPGYEQQSFAPAMSGNRLVLVASPDARNGSVLIHTEADIYASKLDSAATVKHELARGGYGWVQVARGRIDLNDHPLSAGDGAAISDESQLAIRAEQNSELLLFDLA